MLASPGELRRRECDRILNAMRSGEWLREQWIARVAYGLDDGPWNPAFGQRARQLLKTLERDGRVEQRAAAETRHGVIADKPVDFDIPRIEWRIRRQERAA